jgi:hypothetical protein
MQFNFDASAIEPASFTTIPLGDYKVVIRSSEAKETANKDGGYLQFVLEIIDGPLRGTTVFYNLNVHNSNQKTVEIAYRQLSALCHVTGVIRLQDTQQLQGIPFIATIGPQKDAPQYNEVKTVKDINGNAPGKQGQQQQPQQPAAPAWNNQPPQQPQPTAAPAWGAPQPASGGWGGPAPAAAPPAAAPAWGAPAPTAAPAAPAAPQTAWQPNPGNTPAAPPWGGAPAGGPPAWPGK